MIAKIILPRFGGAPNVWNASLLFFQLVLVLGYAYAHWSTRVLGLRRQAMVHIGIMALALATIPFRIPGFLAPHGSANPTPQLLALLAISVGATFFVVSAGAPLIQKWFGATNDPHAKD